MHPRRLYLNDGKGSFDERVEAAGLTGQLGAINAIQTDYNNDGHLDLFVLRGGWEFAHPQLADARQRGRHVHRRHQGGRSA